MGDLATPRIACGDENASRQIDAGVYMAPNWASHYPKGALALAKGLSAIVPMTSRHSEEIGAPNDAAHVTSISQRRQRATGAARISVKRHGTQTVPDRMHQSGPLRLRLPRETPGQAPTAILLNTAGGIAGGDRLALDVTCDAGTELTVSTQGAERLYRALPSDKASRIVTTIRLADGASCDYLPQETILFDRCALDRQLTIDMAGSARFLGIETLIFGRAAMGETIASAWIRDTISLKCDGTLRFHEVFRPPERIAAWQAQAATLGGAAAMATILLASPDAAERLAALRDVLTPFEAGASAWDRLLVGRIVAESGAALRRALLAALAVLRQDRALPRVWHC